MWDMREKNKNMSYINPNKLLTYTRFDVVIKYLYGKSLKEGYNTTFYKEMYKEHLRLWNGFKEYDNPNKNTFESFDGEFKKILNSVKTEGFNPKISKIPTHKGKYILNGAHRLASALVYDKPVFTYDGINGKDGMIDCGYKFFQRLGLSERYCDRVAIEYSKLKKNTHMVFVFPAAKGNNQELINTINRYGNIFYEKSVNLDKNGSFNLMRELYLGEAWAGNYQSNFSGYRHKQQLCYPDYSNTRVFLVEFDSLDISINTKDAIRSIFKIGKHSVHINDTHEETVRLAKLMFNNNSIHHLNKMKTVNYVTFNSCLNDFKQHFKNSKDEIDDYCIGGSSSLSAYGLREGNDLDYLHCNPNLVKDSKDLIHSHNEYGVGRYHIHRDEIIHNPDNHFYHRGVKFASLDVIKKLKEKRNEPKDKNDVNLIINI
jgi:hypothetical protein